MKVLEWLREVCGEFVFDVVAVYRRAGDHAWPLVVGDPDDLERKLAEGGHLLPLPKERPRLRTCWRSRSSTSCSTACPRYTARGSSGD